MKKLSVIIFFVFINSALFPQPLHDSLLKLLNKNLPDTAKLRVLTALTEVTDDVNVWPGYNKQAMTLAEKLVTSTDEIVKRNATIALATAYNNEGLFQDLSGNPGLAMDFFQKSIDIREKLGTPQDLSETLHNIGALYYDIGEFTLARQYFEKSLNLSLEAGDSLNAGISYNYIGMVDIKEKKYDAALQYFEKSLAVFKNSGDKESYATSLVNMGMAYYVKNDWDKAIAFLSEAEQIQKNFNNAGALSSTYKNIGTIHYHKGDVLMALNYGSLALEEAKKSGFPKEIANAEELLAQSYESKKDFSNALIHYKNYVSYHDSIKDQEARKSAIAEQLRAGYEKKAAMLKAEQEKKDALATQEISRQKILKNSLIAGIIFLLLFLLALYSRFMLKKRSSEKLVKAYDDLKHTQQQLLHQEKMASLGQIAAGISHEIQNPLNFVNNFSVMSTELVDEIKNTNDEKEKNELLSELKNNIEKISSHGNRASRIIKSILNQSHPSSSERQPTDVNQLFEEFIMLAYQGMRSNHPDFNCEIVKRFEASTPKILIAPQDIARVILNLANNAFYAVYERSQAVAKQQNTDYKPKVYFSTTFFNHRIFVTVKDNGCGIPDAVKQKIFEPFFTTKSAGNGTGLGLSISYDIIKMHGGEIAMNSRENDFTEFVIQLPG